MKKILLFIISVVCLFAYNYEDDFSSLNKNFWLVFDHGGYHSTPQPPAYEKVYIENGVLKMPVNDTDHGPELVNKYGIPVSKNSIITTSWRIKLHYANEYFAGTVFFNIVDYNTTYPPESINYNLSPDKGIYFARVYYRNYFYNEDKYGHPYSGNNFGFTTWSNKKIILEPIWDQWFTTKVKIDFSNHQACMWINDKLTDCLDINQTFYKKMADLNKTYLKIRFSPYGWFTGHEMDLDNFKIDIRENNSPPHQNNIQKIHKGWNIIGTGIKGDNFDTLFSNYPARIIWKWKDGKWKVWTKDKYLLNYLSDFEFEIIHNLPYLEGYWIYATDDFNVTR